MAAHRRGRVVLVSGEAGIGKTALVRQVRDELPRRVTKLWGTCDPGGLTNRELDVLLLLAEGLRNAEIAQRLVLSEKTVDHHVSAILRKLGVSTRGQAGAAAGRLGLISNSTV